MDAIPLYRRPWFWTIAGVAAFALLYAWSFTHSSIRQPALSALIDAVLFLLSLVAAVGVLAQFVLPTRSWRERRAAAGRLFIYLLGAHGPVVWVQNGQEVAGRGDRKRHGPGVLLIDACSAAVLRTATRFTRAVGPGIVFLQPGEQVAEAVDVRRQVRRLRAEPPDPKVAPTSASSQALTGDGIAVSADLAVTFMLDPGHTLPPREGQSANLPPYEVNPGSAERAVYGHAYGEHEDLPWTELPLRLVVDLWREEVKRYRVEDLLGSRRRASSALPAIRAALISRLTPPPPSPQNVGTAARPPAGRELQVLQSRGIRILDISLSNLQLPTSVRQERLAAWLAEWGADRGTPSSQRGHDSARIDLATALASGLNQRLSSDSPRPSLVDSLRLVLAEAKQLCLASPSPDADNLAEGLDRIAACLVTESSEAEG